MKEDDGTPQIQMVDNQEKLFEQMIEQRQEQDGTP